MTENGKLTFTISSALLSLFVIMAFLLHLITYALSGFFYCAFIAALTLAFGVSKPIARKAVPLFYLVLWLLVITTLWVNYLARHQTNMVLIDDVVLTCGFFVILMFSTKIRDYASAMNVIMIMAMFFAAGVFLQRFMPGIFKLILQVFPAKFRNAITEADAKNQFGLKGFTINVGFTANYVLAGIFVLIAKLRSGEKHKIKGNVEIILLCIALILTAKRGPIIFAVLSILIVLIIPYGNSERMKKIWRGILITLIICAVFWMMKNQLKQVSFLKRYIESIEGILNGQDVSSGRFTLYQWAIHLFLESPVWGIGWGKYRHTLAGNTKIITSLDTHNVYLQLLCETGIVGFFIFVSVFLASWIMTKDAYCFCFRNHSETNHKWRPALLFSFLFQTYFLLLALTGNPLYDQFYQVIYAFSCSITMAYRFVYLNRTEERDVKESKA